MEKAHSEIETAPALADPAVWAEGWAAPLL
jgi:hypothetical protein